MYNDDILTGYIVRVPKDGGGWDSVDVAFLTDIQIEWLTVSTDAAFLSKNLEGTLKGVRTLVARHSYLAGQMAGIEQRLDDLDKEMEEKGIK